MKECIITHRLITRDDGSHTAKIRIIAAETGEIAASRELEYNEYIPRSKAGGLSLDEAYRLAADKGFEHAKEIATNINQ